MLSETVIDTLSSNRSVHIFLYLGPTLITKDFLMLKRISSAVTSSIHTFVTKNLSLGKIKLFRNGLKYHNEILLREEGANLTQNCQISFKNCCLLPSNHSLNNHVLKINTVHKALYRH